MQAAQISRKIRNHSCNRWSSSQQLRDYLGAM